MLIAWFSATLALSAFLLFLIQPMFAKMVLPLLGGTPAVWNTCVLFFQTALLAAYAYAHLVSRRIGVARYAPWHLALLLLPALSLPISLPASWAPPDHASPSGWLLFVLLTRVGLPFFAVSTTAPLLQRWVAAMPHAAARDPYFLYAASNAGSLLGLLAYPFLVEPSVRLANQGRWWTAGYALLVVAIATCALWVQREAAPAARTARDAARARPSRADRMWWVLLSAVPSSLLLGVTTYISTDLAAVPLLWVVPMTLYLLTFILAFAEWPPVPPGLLYRLYALVILPLAMFMASGVEAPKWLIPLHLGAFVLAAFLCHRILALRRPAPAHLTEYYLWMSLGGAIGGVFNGLIAPHLFRSIAEYPLAIALACFAPLAERGQRAQPVNSLWPLGYGGLVLALILAVRAAGAELTPVGDVLIYVVPVLVCFAFRRSPARFGLCLGMFLLIHLAAATGVQRMLDQRRSFFGVHRVMFRQPAGEPFGYHLLMHGRTLHGAQSLDPARRCDPLSYFNREGPLGELMESVGVSPAARVAVIGLGAGSVASYRQPGQAWTFYEIDPEVASIAGDGRYFTFLSACAPESAIVLGDGRRMIAQAPDRSYDLLIIDAFSSASIPAHLLTQEALALYLRKLTPGAVIAFHISNPYFDLERVLGNACRTLQTGCLARTEVRIGPTREALGHRSSQWVVISASPEPIERLARVPRWHAAGGAPGEAAWTDDFSNVLGALRNER